MLNTLGIQRPQWKTRAAIGGATAHEDPADLFGEDVDNIDKMYLDADANIPNAGHHEAAGTTASEFDGALDEAGLEDEDAGQEAIKYDDSELDEEPKRQKNIKVCNWFIFSPLSTTS